VSARILSLSDLSAIGSVKNFEEQRRDAFIRLDREERLETWARDRGYDLGDFFCGSTPSFVSVSTTSRATCEEDVVRL
jgi:hypothetical protein